MDTENPQDNSLEALAEGGPFDSILEGQLTAMAAEREQFAAEKVLGKRHRLNILLSTARNVTQTFNL